MSDQQLRELLRELVMDNGLTCEPQPGYVCQCSTARALREIATTEHGTMME